jgi:hypothetical protein
MTTLEAEAAPRPIDRRLRRAALLIAPGLAIQAATLGSSHPLAFIAFIFPGGLLVAAGIVVFLWAIASA